MQEGLRVDQWCWGMRWRRKRARLATAVVVETLLLVTAVVLAALLVAVVATALEEVVVVGRIEAAEEMRDDEVDAMDGVVVDDAARSAAMLAVTMALEVVASPLNPPSLRSVGSTCFSRVMK